MHRLVYHIDSASWITDDDAAIRVAGWCARDDGGAIREFRAVSTSGLDLQLAPTARADVATHLGRPSARDSGFCFLLPWIKPDEVVTISAVDERGNASSFYSFRPSELPGRSAVITGYSNLRASGWPSTVRKLEVTMPARVDPIAGRPIRFSILLPVHNTPAGILSECLESVLSQTYAHWEVCAVDDGSERNDTRDLLDAFARRDPRVRPQMLPQRTGIANATNHALHVATGDYVVMLDHDDRLLPQALDEFAAAILRCEETGPLERPESAFPTNKFSCDVLYSDEEKISESGEPRRPILKPAFSPAFFRGVMYIGHALCVRRSVALAAGGFDPAFDGIQDYEFALRLSEKTRRFVHVPAILYQWRMMATSSATDGNVKGDIDRLQLSALNAHLARLGRSAETRALGGHRAALLPTPDLVRPPVTLFATHRTVNSPCWHAPENCDVILAEDSTAALAAIDRHSTDPRSRLIAFIDLCLSALSASWLDHLAFLALDPESARIAPILRSAPNRILEAGRTIDSDGIEHVLMSGFDPAADGYNGSLACTREVLTLTPSCWIMEARPTRGQFRYNRICATAWIETTSTWSPGIEELRAYPPGVVPGDPDPFFNALFQPRSGDYSLLEATP